MHSLPERTPRLRPHRDCQPPRLRPRGPLHVSGDSADGCFVHEGSRDLDRSSAAVACGGWRMVCLRMPFSLSCAAYCLCDAVDGSVAVRLSLVHLVYTTFVFCRGLSLMLFLLEPSLCPFHLHLSPRSSSCGSLFHAVLFSFESIAALPASANQAERRLPLFTILSSALQRTVLYCVVPFCSSSSTECCTVIVAVPFSCGVVGVLRRGYQSLPGTLFAGAPALRPWSFAVGNLYPDGRSRPIRPSFLPSVWVLGVALLLFFDDILPWQRGCEEPLERKLESFQ